MYIQRSQDIYFSFSFFLQFNYEPRLRFQGLKSDQPFHFFIYFFIFSFLLLTYKILASSYLGPPPEKVCVCVRVAVCPFLHTVTYTQLFGRVEGERSGGITGKKFLSLRLGYLHRATATFFRPGLAELEACPGLDGVEQLLP